MKKSFFKRSCIRSYYVVPVFMLLAFSVGSHAIQRGGGDASSDVALSTQSKLSEKPQQETTEKPQKVAKEAAVKSEDTATKEATVDNPAQTKKEVASNTPAATPPTPKKKTNSQKPQTKVPQKPAPQPFKVTGVRLNGAHHFCSNGYVILQVASATVTTSGSSGGKVGYKVEFDGKLSYQSYAEPYFIQVQKNASAAQITSAGAPGYLISTHPASPGQSVRVRTTTPNAVASPWYSVPSNYDCR